MRNGHALARRHPLGPQTAERQVAIAQAEPDLLAAGTAPVHLLPRVAVDAPAALVDHVGQPVGDQVRVGGDVHAVMLGVVAGVGDHDELARADDIEHPARELRAAGPAGEDDYQSSSGSPVIRTPAWVL
jgi:hypothetical protein